jgi:hypothetical protein
MRRLCHEVYGSNQGTSSAVSSSIESNIIIMQKLVTIEVVHLGALVTESARAVIVRCASGRVRDVTRAASLQDDATSPTRARFLPVTLTTVPIERNAVSIPPTDSIHASSRWQSLNKERLLTLASKPPDNRRRTSSARYANRTSRSGR